MRSGCEASEQDLKQSSCCHCNGCDTVQGQTKTQVRPRQTRSLAQVWHVMIKAYIGYVALNWLRSLNFTLLCPIHARCRAVKYSPLEARSGRDMQISILPLLRNILTLKSCLQPQNNTLANLKRFGLSQAYSAL